MVSASAGLVSMRCFYRKVSGMVKSVSASGNARSRVLVLCGPSIYSEVSVSSALDERSDVVSHELPGNGTGLLPSVLASMVDSLLTGSCMSSARSTGEAGIPVEGVQGDFLCVGVYFVGCG